MYHLFYDGVVMDEQRFRRLADETFKRILDGFDAIDADDADVETAGNTIQIKVHVRLSGELTSLGDGWQPDGPGRWWNANAVVTVDAGIATWESSSRAIS